RDMARRSIVARQGLKGAGRQRAPGFLRRRNARYDGRSDGGEEAGQEQQDDDPRITGRSGAGPSRGTFRGVRGGGGSGAAVSGGRVLCPDTSYGPAAAGPRLGLDPIEGLGVCRQYHGPPLDGGAQWEGATPWLKH